MGCTSLSSSVQMRRVVPLPPEVINSYIDRFPTIIVHKLKEKFEALCDKDMKEMTHFNFLKLYAVARLDTEVIKKLFAFFTDNRKQNLKFRQFMAKYATIIKSQPQTFFMILFELYKSSFTAQSMSEEEYQTFLRIQKQFLQEQHYPTAFPLSYKQFVQNLIACNFDAQGYQKRFVVTTESDVPFETISRELAECDFNDLTAGRSYFILSAEWFYRWSFYYQEVNLNFDRCHFKSTKIMKEDLSSISKKGLRLKESSPSRSCMGEEGTLLEQPNRIDFSDIQGEYLGELRENIKVSLQCKLITAKLWQLLCSLHPAEQAFERTAISSAMLEYYPKSVYYCQADARGEIVPGTNRIQQVSSSRKLEFLVSQEERQIHSVFTKNFGQVNWREEQFSSTIAEISLEPRFLICKVGKRESFIEKNYRRQINAYNVTVGDKIYAHFPYLKSHSEGVIIGLLKGGKVRIHYKGYSYLYQREIQFSELSVLQSQAALASSKKKNESIIKGITNIGNTCFINAIVQCLVATPILDEYLQAQEFHQDKQPISYSLAQMAKRLLRNEKPNPQEFKKQINACMPQFSGYDQHDAQEFLNLLLDKMDEQISDKPTIIDFLFGGKVQSKLTCVGCKKVKKIDEKMYILSLPIPEPEYNYFSVIVVPVSQHTIRKVTMRLHRTATISDYLDLFQARSHQNRKDFIFCESIYNSLKKLRLELTTANHLKKRVIDLGIVPNVILHAFEKLPVRLYYDLLSEKTPLPAMVQYCDYQHPTETYWTVCKTTDLKNDKEKFMVEYLTPDNEFEKVELDRKQIDKATVKLGNKAGDISYKKLIQRKTNSVLNKMDSFGIQFLVGIPMWASYRDVVAIVEAYTVNMRTKDATLMAKGRKGDYMIRLLDPVKLRCIFCMEESGVPTLKDQNVVPCCQVEEKEIPLCWAARNRSFWIYLEWLDFSKCNSSFCSYINQDPCSLQAGECQEQKINLEQCLQLHQQTEKVEMQCEGCKDKFQSLQYLISGMPNILVLHMKQFRYTSEGHLIKLDIRLKWQQFLDSSKYSMNLQGRIYELFAFVRHSGSSQSGHYTCMTKKKHPFESRRVWVNFDDDVTEIVRQEQKNIDDAYLLFYKKVDMPTSAFVNYTDMVEDQ